MPLLFAVGRPGPPLSCHFYVGGSSEFEHSFGGPPRHTGVTPPGGPRPWHLLFNIDLADPRLELHIPGIRWLPLYNALQYDSSPTQYRLRSDSEIEIVRQEKNVFTPEFPYEGFPDQFPFRSVGMADPEEIVFDEEKQSLWWELLCDQGDGWELQKRPPNRNELCALAGGVNQTQVVGRKTCENCRERMDILASMTGEFAGDDVNIWGWDDYVAVVYHICPKCFTIDVANLVN